jgi:hypothetical protein
MKHFGQHGQPHRRSMLDHIRKKGTTVLAFLVMGVAAYLAFTTIGDGSLLGSAAVVGADSVSEDFSVAGSFDFSTVLFEVRDSTVKLRLGDDAATYSSGTLLIDGLNLESFQGTQIVLSGFEGTIGGGNADSVVALNGKAKSAILDNVVINKNGEFVSVETGDLRFDLLSVSDISLSDFSLDGDGSVTVAGRGSFDITKNKIRLKPFSGVISADHTGMTITGQTRKVLIDGNPGVVIE